MPEQQMGSAMAQPGMEQPEMGADREMIEKVKAALMNGASPEELMQAGVPQEILEIAIQELQAEMQSQQGGQMQGGQMPQQGGSAFA